MKLVGMGQLFYSYLVSIDADVVPVWSVMDQDSKRESGH